MKRIIFTLFISGLAFLLTACPAPEPVTDTPIEPLPIPFIISDGERAKTTAQILLLLESNSPADRQRAKEQLRQIRLPPHLRELLDDVDNPDARIAEAARRSLVREGKTIQALAKFEQDSLAEWNSAREELVKLGPEALTAMVQVLSYKFRSNDVRYQEWGREQIRSAGVSVLYPLYMVLLRSRHSDEIFHLTLALAEMGRVSERMVNEIIMSNNLNLSINVVSALGESGETFWFNKLTELLLNDKRWEIRGEAASALAKLGDPGAAPYLIRGLNDADAFVQKNCIKALGDLREPTAVSYLVKLLDRKENPALVKTSIEALGDIKDQAAIPHLIELLDSKDEFDLAKSALISLIKITGKRLSGNPEVWRKWWEVTKNQNR